MRTPHAELRLARIALVRAGVDPLRRAQILATLAAWRSPSEVAAERDELLRKAYAAIGDGPGVMPILIRALSDYVDRHWHAHRHLAAPPPGLGELRAILFKVCLVCEEGGKDFPSERTIRRALEPCQNSEIVREAA